MRDVGERAELVLEAAERGGVEVAQRLERDDLVPLAIERLVDDAHAAGAEPALDDEPIPTDSPARFFDCRHALSRLYPNAQAVFDGQPFRGILVEAQEPVVGELVVAPFSA